MNVAEVSMEESNSVSNEDEAVKATTDFIGAGNDEMDSVEVIEPEQGLPVQTGSVQSTEIDINVIMSDAQGKDLPNDTQEGTSVEGFLVDVQRQALSLEFDSTALQSLQDQLLQHQYVLSEAQRQYDALQASYLSLSQANTSLHDALTTEKNQFDALQAEYQLLATSFQSQQQQINTYQRELVLLRELTKPTHYLRDLVDQPKRNYDFPPGAQLAALFESDCRRLSVFLDNLTLDELRPVMLGDDAIIASYVPQLLAAVWRRAEERVQLFLKERAQALEAEFGVTDLATYFNDHDPRTRPPIDGATNVVLRFFVTYLQRRGVHQLMQAVAQEVTNGPSPSEDLTAFRNDTEAWIVAKVLQSPEALWLHNIIKTLREKGGDDGCLSQMESSETVLSLYETFVRWLILCRCSDPLVQLSPAIGTALPNVESLADVNQLVASKSVALINHIKIKGKDLPAIPVKAFVALPGMGFTMRWQTIVPGFTNDDATAVNEVRPCYSYVVEGEKAINELNSFVTTYAPQQLALRDALIRGVSTAPTKQVLASEPTTDEVFSAVLAVAETATMDVDGAVGIISAAPMTAESEQEGTNDVSPVIAVVAEGSVEGAISHAVAPFSAPLAPIEQEGTIEESASFAPVEDSANVAAEDNVHANAVDHPESRILPSGSNVIAASESHHHSTHPVGEVIAASLESLHLQGGATGGQASSLVVESPVEESTASVTIAKKQRKGHRGKSDKPVDDRRHDNNHNHSDIHIHNHDGVQSQAAPNVNGPFNGHFTGSNGWPTHVTSSFRHDDDTLHHRQPHGSHESHQPHGSHDHDPHEPHIPHGDGRDSHPESMNHDHVAHHNVNVLEDTRDVKQGGRMMNCTATSYQHTPTMAPSHLNGSQNMSNSEYDEL